MTKWDREMTWDLTKVILYFGLAIFLMLNNEAVAEYFTNAFIH